MLKQERFVLAVHRGPVRGPKKWRGRNAIMKDYAVDIFRTSDGAVLAVRMYESIYRTACWSELVNGKRWEGEEGLAKARAWWSGITKSICVKVIRCERVSGREATYSDTRL